MTSGAAGTPAPGETPQPSPGTSPTPSASHTPTPSPTPFPTPLPCGFYAIEKSGKLWGIDPTGPHAVYVGTTGLDGLTDIAITQDQKVVVIGGQAALLINPLNGQTSLLAGMWLSGQNALGVMNDGRLLVGGGTELRAVDIASGATTDMGSLPSGRTFAGDIFVRADGIAFASAIDSFGADGAPDRLIRIDLASGNATDVGALGFEHVYGLDADCDGTVYGVTEGTPDQGIKPRVLRVDVDHATVTDVGFLDGPVQIWGATGPH